MKILAKKLAELAEKSPGYSVTLSEGWELTNIRFGTSRSGRKDRFVFHADINGKPGTWSSDTMFDLKD